MVTRWMTLALGAAALAILGIAAAPGAAAAEPGVAAQLSFSFGAGKPRLKLGIGAQHQRPAALPGRPRPMAFRPVVELSARVSPSHRRVEDLRLNGLPLGRWALYADEGEEENGEEENGAEESGGNGSRVALVLGGVAAGVLILSYVVADDIKDDVLDAIDGA